MTFPSVAMFDYRPGALIRVCGEDAFSFLQGQFTNDLRPPPGSVTYGLWLNQKGRILADSHVLRMTENEFLVTSVASAAATIRSRLEEYIVADDVTLTNETAASHGLLLYGQGSREALEYLIGAVPASGRWVQYGGSWMFDGRRCPGESIEIIGPENHLEEIRRQLRAQGVKTADAGELEFSRICAGIPIVPADLGLGDLPNEGGLEDTALSYAKGCYLGQEVTARLKHLGQVRRRLHAVQGRGSAPVSGTAIYQGGNKLGEIRSVAARGDEFVAMAMLSLVKLNPEIGFSLEPSGPASINRIRHG